MRVNVLYMRGLDSAVVKSLACHCCDPGLIPGVGMWQGSGRPHKAGGFSQDLRFSPPCMTIAGLDSLVYSDATWDVKGTGIYFPKGGHSATETGKNNRNTRKVKRH